MEENLGSALDFDGGCDWSQAHNWPFTEIGALAR